MQQGHGSARTQLPGWKHLRAGRTRPGSSEGEEEVAAAVKIFQNGGNGVREPGFINGTFLVCALLVHYAIFRLLLTQFKQTPSF